MTLLLLLFMIVIVLAMSLIYDLYHKNSTYNYSSKVSTSVSALELTAIKSDLSVNMILTNCVLACPPLAPLYRKRFPFSQIEYLFYVVENEFYCCTMAISHLQPCREELMLEGDGWRKRWGMLAVTGWRNGP